MLENFNKFNSVNVLKNLFKKINPQQYKANTKRLSSWINYLIMTRPRKLIFWGIICFQRIPIKHWLCILRSTLHPLRQYQSPADRHTKTNTQSHQLYSFSYSLLRKQACTEPTQFATVQNKCRYKIEAEKKDSPKSTIKVVHISKTSRVK